MLKKWVTLAVAVVLLMNVATAVYAAEAEPKKWTFGEILFELGLINGTDQGLQEDKEINRAQMVAILNRLSEREGDKPFTPPAVPTFSDVPKTHWAYSDVEKAYANGVTTGIGQGKFGVGNKVTHQQAVTFLARVAGYDIDYANAIEEGWEIGIILMSSQSATANLYRGDVFELMTYTLIIPIDEEQEIYLVHQIPSISEEKLEWFLSDELAFAYNPMAQSLSYEAIPDTYTGDVEQYAEASRRQFAYTSEVAKVVGLYKGLSEITEFDVFFQHAAKGEAAFALPYEWSSYSDSLEWGEFGYYGSTQAVLTADGVLSGEIQATEGGDYLEAADPNVWVFEPVTVDGKKVTPYYISLNMWTMDEDDYALIELYVLVDEQGVYKTAVVGSHGDGVYARK